MKFLKKYDQNFENSKVTEQLNNDPKQMYYLEHAEASFLKKMSLISWEAGQWMQYTGCEYDKEHDTLILNFKSSSYGIGFDVKVRAFNSGEGYPDIEYSDAYNYFRDIKYKLKPQHK